MAHWLNPCLFVSLLRSMNLDYSISATFSLLNWLFFHTIYGMLGVAILVYLLFRDLRKTFPRFPEPALVAGLVFLAGVGTLPSIPRYQFHNEMLKLLPSDRRHWRWCRPGGPSCEYVEMEINDGTTNVGEPTNRCCDAHLAPISPRVRRPGSASPLSRTDFYEWTFRYGEKPAESMVDTDCVKSTIRYTRPDESGILLRPVTPSPVKMVAREKNWYCAHDWSREKEALRRSV